MKQSARRIPDKKRRSSTRPRTRLDPAVRRDSIVAAAFKAVAEDGFEGLRTRDIADRAGINSATLHHYFPTKEDLIAAVARHLETRLRSERAAPVDHGRPGVLAAVDSQIQDLLLYHRERPDILAVYREFVARAPRDPMIRALVEALHAGWRAGIIDALKRGRDDGSLRSGLDLDATASIILSTAWGFVSQIFASPEELAAAARQLTEWMGAKGCD
jgi:AcrR family transcriptional regulator